MLKEETELGPVQSLAQLGHGTNSAHSWDTVVHWVKSCEENHAKCNRRWSGHDFVPTRLLDLGPLSATWPPESLQVVETKQNAIKAAYVTLSHCWGKKLFRTLRTEDIQKSGNASISWEDICKNKNFAESIEVARHLRSRYIWIDSLCIIQNDKNEDFNKEGPRMHQIYRNSYCNIAAADSEDCEGGLFRVRDAQAEHSISTRYHPKKWSSTFQDRTWRVFPGDAWEKDLLDRVLYTRAWVFQGIEELHGDAFSGLAADKTHGRAHALSAASSLLQESDLLGLQHHHCLRNLAFRDP